ncbi:hypothetical protein ACE6H2_013878 [Prunus campanulata]
MGDSDGTFHMRGTFQMAYAYKVPTIEELQRVIEYNGLYPRPHVRINYGEQDWHVVVSSETWLEKMSLKELEAVWKAMTKNMRRSTTRKTTMRWRVQQLRRTTLPCFWTKKSRAFMVERYKDKEISGVEPKRGDSRGSKDPKRNRTKR